MLFDPNIVELLLTGGGGMERNTAVVLESLFSICRSDTVKQFNGSVLLHFNLVVHGEPRKHNS